MNAFKIAMRVCACGVLVAGIGVASANAEESQANSSTEQSSSEHLSAPASGSTNQKDSGDARSGVVMRGGYNVGRATENVPGCVGPVSFCNMYFGS